MENEIEARDIEMKEIDTFTMANKKSDEHLKDNSGMRTISSIRQSHKKDWTQGPLRQNMEVERSYNYYNGEDMNDEKKTQWVKSANGRDVFEVEGEWENEWGDGLRSDANYYMKLKEYDFYLIKNVPIRSPLFRYTIMCCKLSAKKRFSDTIYTVFTCCEITKMKPLPIIYYDIMRIYDLSSTGARVNRSNEARQFADLMLKISPSCDGITQKKSFLYDKLCLYLKQQKTDLNRLKSCRELKLYFLDEDIAFLTNYYKADYVHRLWWEDIQALAVVLREGPLELCFQNLVDFRWVYMSVNDDQEHHSRIQKNDLDTMLLPELEYEIYCQMIGYDPSAAIEKQSIMEPINIDKFKALVRVRMYDDMKKDYYEEKHMYSVRSVILRKIACIFNNEDIVIDAIKWLVEREVIVEEEGKLYLYHAYKSEMCIAQCFERLFEKKCISNVADLFNNESQEKEEKNFRPSDEKIHKAEEDMCSEQLEAFRWHLDNPILFVTGQGGCGKTSLLHKIINFYEPDYPMVDSGNKIITTPKQVFCTAFQDTNVEDLNKISPSIAYTTHKILFYHDNICKTKYGRPQNSRHQSLYSGEGRIKYTKGMHLHFEKCVLENAKILIVDELSLEYPEIFAKLLSCMLNCGQLKKLILVGDCNQLPSIYPGDLIGELALALKEMDCFFEFKHNHRTKNELLNSNREAIRNADPSKFIFDDKTCIHVNMTVEPDEVSSLIVDILQKYSIGEHEHHIITRTNKVKNNINSSIEEYYSTNRLSQSNGLQVGGKYVFKKNNYDKNIANNKLLVLKRIESAKETCDWTDFADDFPLFSIVPEDQDIYLNRDSSLRCILSQYPLPFVEIGITPNSKSYGGGGGDDEKDYRYVFEPLCNMKAKKHYSPMHLITNTEIVLEKDDWFNRYIEKGYATTVNAFQGNQEKIIIYVNPYNRKEQKRCYETNKVAYTSFSRAQEIFIYIGTREAWDASIRNPEPMRRSQLAKKITLFCKKYMNDFPKKTLPITSPRQLDIDREMALLEGKEEDIFEPFFVNNGVNYFRNDLVSKDILVSIFSYFRTLEEMLELVKLTRVCKSWKDICLSNQIWKDLILGLNTDVFFVSGCVDVVKSSIYTKITGDVIRAIFSDDETSFLCGKDFFDGEIPKSSRRHRKENSALKSVILNGYQNDACYKGFKMWFTSFNIWKCQYCNRCQWFYSEKISTKSETFNNEFRGNCICGYCRKSHTLRILNIEDPATRGRFSTNIFIIGGRISPNYQCKTIRNEEYLTASQENLKLYNEIKLEHHREEGIIKEERKIGGGGGGGGGRGEKGKRKKTTITKSKKIKKRKI